MCKKASISYVYVHYFGDYVNYKKLFQRVHINIAMHLISFKDFVVKQTQKGYQIIKRILNESNISYN